MDSGSKQKKMLANEVTFNGKQHRECYLQLYKRSRNYEKTTVQKLGHGCHA